MKYFYDFTCMRSLSISTLMVLCGVMTTGCGANNLFDAAKGNQVDRIVVLVKAGADINAADTSGFTPLHWAAYKGQVEAVETLLEYGANIDARDGDHATPLFVAVLNRQTLVAKFLLAKGAKPDFPNKDGWTALMEAACNRDPETAEALLAQHWPQKFNRLGHVAWAPGAHAPSSSGAKR